MKKTKIETTECEKMKKETENTKSSLPFTIQRISLETQETQEVQETFSMEEKEQREAMQSYLEQTQYEREGQKPLLLPYVVGVQKPQTQQGLFALAFFLPFVLMFIIYAVMGVFPFGDRSVLTVDLYNQYAPFFYQYQEKILQGENLFYSIYGGLGTHFYSLWAYYLASPFNFFLFVFPNTLMPLGVTLLTLIKTGLLSLSMSVFLKKTHLFKKELRYEEEQMQFVSVLIASLMYAMSGYVLAYAWNLMWLDALIFLPMVLLGLSQLLKEGKMLLYFVSLSVCVCSNYYAAFFVCLFTMLEFFYFVAVDESFPIRNQETFVCLKRKTLGKFLLRSLQTLLASACSLGFSSIVLLPVYASLKQTSAVRDSFPQSMDFLFSFFAFMERYALASAPNIRSGLPNLFTGVFSYFVLSLYLLCPRIRLKEKVASFVLWLVLYLSLSNKVLNFVWHGLHYPNQMPHRFAFVFTFFSVCLLYRVLMHWHSFSLKRTLPFLAVQILLFVLYFFVQTENKINQAFAYAFFLNLFFMLFYLFFFAMSKKYHLSHAGLSFLLVLLFFTESFMHGLVNIGYIAKNEYYGGHTFFVEHQEEVQAFKSFIEKKEAFYRMEVYPRKTSNDLSMYRLPGLSSFSSTNPYALTKFMAALGYFTNGVNSYMQEQQSPLMDMLFSVKYHLRKKTFGRDLTLQQNQEILQEAFAATAKHTLYERKLVLPLGYQVEKNILSYMPKKEEAFAEQEAFVSALTGFPMEKQLYLETPLKEDKAFTPVFASVLQDELTAQGLRIRIEKKEEKEKDDEAQVHLLITAEEDGQHYLYTTNYWKTASYEIERVLVGEEQGKDALALVQQKQELQAISQEKSLVPTPLLRSVLSEENLPKDVSEERVEKTKNNARPMVFDLGYIEKGKSVRLILKTKRLEGQSYSFWAKRLDLAKMSFVYDKLSLHPFQLEDFQSGSFKGKITMAKNAYLFLSIPYDASWRFKVDGKEVKALSFADKSFTLIPLEKGLHQVEGQFIPYLWEEAVKLSLISFAVFCVFAMLSFALRKKNSVHF